MHNNWRKIVVILMLAVTSHVPAWGADKTPARAILLIGDSLSAEYGLQRGSGWVNHLQSRLEQHQSGYHIHNSSISGDTSSGGLSRLPEALDRIKPDIVIIELGSNDALRGLSLDMTRNNLAKMIELVASQNAQALLVGMQLPPNYGRQYARQFASLYTSLADEYQLPLVPFLMDGMAEDRELFQDDGIHPNEKAQAILADNVWPVLKPLLNP